MNARKRARRRAERERPTVVMQDTYRPKAPDWVRYRIPALDGNGRTVVVAITGEQARKLGFSEGLIQREVADAWKRIACTNKGAGAAEESNPEPG
jgi:hypothetical protein